ncbi:hypothetical protein JAAARDRAFT_313538 [Jaapia argillacea MUCL 33604]|uniref:Coenzyme Q-binding protein COQ10 START domain-containing protein n=1 Tax=Jaapia argillacea MUCL 33604 TaxID=933084 RepID=A0A067PZX9_9AGAM|nr:hypothetical protein JAAARDRAFT_313538 [Jaapia argillacea MUCL 33604]
MTSNNQASPHDAGGVVAVSASTIIDSPRDNVWRVLLDFPSYGEWNPFVRAQAIVNADKTPCQDPTPAEGKHLLIYANIPPTMDKTPSKPSAFEIITLVDNENYRISWRNIDFPSKLLVANRWQTLSEVEGGKTKYETTEVFNGLAAYYIRWFLAKDLQKSFDAFAEGLKMRSEGS